MQRVPKHIYWSASKPVEVDLTDPAQKKWWIKQVLTNGTMEDVCTLDPEDIRECLPHLQLPRPVRALWSDYFAERSTQPVPSEGS